MLLFIHIAIALASVAFSTFMFFTPSETKLKLTYLMTLGTLITAGGLIVFNHANIGHTCLTGLAYLGLVSVNIFLTKKKLSVSESTE